MSSLVRKESEIVHEVERHWLVEEDRLLGWDSLCVPKSFRCCRALLVDIPWNTGWRSGVVLLDWQTKHDVALLASSVVASSSHWCTGPVCSQVAEMRIHIWGHGPQPERVECSPWVRGGLLPQVEEFNYHRVLLMSGAKGEWEIDRRIEGVSVVMQMLYWSFVVRREVSTQATYGHKFWVVTKQRRLWIQMTKLALSEEWLASPLEIGWGVQSF